MFVNIFINMTLRLSLCPPFAITRDELDFRFGLNFQTPVWLEPSIIYRSCICTTSISDSFPLSMVPKKTEGAGTWHIPRNCWHQWTLPYMTIFVEWWNPSPRLSSYISDEISGSCHWVRSSGRIHVLCQVHQIFFSINLLVFWLIMDLQQGTFFGDF